MTGSPDTAPPRIDSIEELASLMRADGVVVQVDAAHHRLQAANNIAGENAPLFVEWNSAQGAAQVIQALPWRVAEDRLADAAVAMVRANHESVLPAFGLNASAGIAYCRGVIPLLGGASDVPVVRSLIATVTRIAREQGPAVAAAWRPSA